MLTFNSISKLMEDGLTGKIYQVVRIKQSGGAGQEACIEIAQDPLQCLMDQVVKHCLEKAQ